MLEVNHFVQGISASMETVAELSIVMLPQLLELMPVVLIKQCGSDIKSLIAGVILLVYGE